MRNLGHIHSKLIARVPEIKSRLWLNGTWQSRTGYFLQTATDALIGTPKPVWPLGISYCSATAPVFSITSARKRAFSSSDQSFQTTLKESVNKSPVSSTVAAP